MCLMCIEVAKSRMTIKEARNAIPEMIASNTSDEELQKHLKSLQDANDEKLLEIAQKIAQKTTTD